MSDLLDGDSAEAATLTFDDGTQDFADVALPVLGGDRATIYVVTSLLGQTNRWDDGDVPVRLMDARTLKVLQANGFEIGSHTRTHADLCLASADATGEIEGSRSDLEALLGSPPRTFCYPYGRSRPEAEAIVGGSGYEGAVTTRKGGFIPGSDPFRIPRIAVRNDTSLPVLVYKLWRARRFGR